MIFLSVNMSAKLVVVSHSSSLSALAGLPLCICITLCATSSYHVFFKSLGVPALYCNAVRRLPSEVSVRHSPFKTCF